MPDLPPLPARAHARSADAPTPLGFGFDVELSGGETVVSVRGDVDRTTAPTLGEILDPLIDRCGQRPFVLDLAQVTFMNAAGLTVIARAVTGLAARSMELVVRSAPEATRRIMGITGLIDHVVIEAGPPLHVDVARGHNRRPHDVVLDASLRLVTGLAARTVDGAQGASISLEREGRMTTVAATDETIARMDDHQYATGEGPCLSAAAEGVPVLVESLREEDRWPTFIPRAMGEGITSILSSPLVITGRAVGALNVYANASGAFHVHQQELASAFATEASDLLSRAFDEDIAAAELAVRTRQALATRDLIARAEGVLMARRGETAAEAATHLHRSARSSDLSVAAAAHAVLSSTQPADTPTPRGGDDG